MDITYKQYKWLDSRGGRTEDDLLFDGERYYVEMGGRGPTGLRVIKKIYLPIYERTTRTKNKK